MVERPDVLIIDDHPLFREALETALAQACPDGVVTRHAGSIGEASETLRSAPAHLVLLDLNLSDARDFDGLARIGPELDGAPVYVVSATETPEAYAKAKALGAAGYLPKSLTMAQLSAALSTALRGETWFPEAARPANDEVAERLSTLTPAQTRVLSGLAAGLLNKQIAFEMGISEATVKAHMTAIFRKLGANNRTQALLVYKAATSLGEPPAA